LYAVPAHIDISNCQLPITDWRSFLPDEQTRANCLSHKKGQTQISNWHRKLAMFQIGNRQSAIGNWKSLKLSGVPLDDLRACKESQD
jgi:hypothetical protein